MRALLLLLTACWSSSQSAAPPPPQPSEPVASSSAFRTHATSSCQRAVDRIGEKLRPEFVRTGLSESTVDELIATSIESCHAMDWSSELIACLDKTDDANNLSECQSLMTPEQAEDFTRRLTEAIARSASTQLPPPPTP